MTADEAIDAINRTILTMGSVIEDEPGIYAAACERIRFAFAVLAVIEADVPGPRIRGAELTSSEILARATAAVKGEADHDR